MRLAQFSDHDAITGLITLSARQLGGEFYDENTIETALKGAFGLDTQLIKDQTYYLIYNDEQLIGCGGWSFRKTLFGSDSNNIRNPDKLNPKTEAAKIRAFFIHPDFARQGLGLMLLNRCEDKAKENGFSKTQLMSTLSGISFYQRNGYVGDKYIFHRMDDQNEIKFLPMLKNLINI